jgi:hypothetical protein
MPSWRSRSCWYSTKSASRCSQVNTSFACFPRPTPAMSHRGVYVAHRNALDSAPTLRPVRRDVIVTVAALPESQQSASSVTGHAAVARRGPRAAIGDHQPVHGSRASSAAMNIAHYLDSERRRPPAGRAEDLDARWESVKRHDVPFRLLLPRVTHRRQLRATNLGDAIGPHRLSRKLASRRH